MSLDSTDLRWLKSPRQQGSGSGDGLLRQAVRSFIALDASGTNESALDPSAKGNSVAKLAIEETTPIDRPTLILASMPLPATRGQKSIDILLRCAGIRLLLANPLAFVVFVTSLTRASLDEELRRWFSHSVHNKIAARSPYHHLATRQLVGWAFLTLDELNGCQERLRARRDQLHYLTRSVATDVSGLRSLLHLLIAEGEVPARFLVHLLIAEGETRDRIRRRMPPRFALVVDDEEETAARLSSLVRRWGYSVLTVDRPAAWRWVRSGDLDLEQHFELAVVDNVLGFEGSPLPEGHEWLRGLSIRHKIFKTGAREHESPPADEIHIGPQIADSFQLRQTCCAVEPEWEPQGVLFSPRSYSDRPDLHSELRGLVIGLGHRLVESARRVQDSWPRLAALHHLEAFSLVERLDGPLAARSFLRLQEFEIETLCERAPGAIDRALLESRLVAIRQSIERCFDCDHRTNGVSDRTDGNSPEVTPSEAGFPKPPSGSRGSDNPADKGSRIDAGLWISRIITHLEATLKRYPISARLHQILEIERRRQQQRTQQLSNSEATPLAAWILTFWNWLSRHMSSLQRVALGWLFVVLVFGIYYSLREAASLGVHLDAGIWLRGLGASLSCGLGFLYPHVYDFSIPTAELYCFEFLQRSLALVLLARAIELVVGWFRYGS